MLKAKMPLPYGVAWEVQSGAGGGGLLPEVLNLTAAKNGKNFKSKS
jgi:hypothetical protein